MKFFKPIFFIGMLLGSPDSYAGLPSFEDYPVSTTEIFAETPALVDLSSYSEAKKFRTKLQNAASQGPNFAGHYTVVSIGCGTQCQENWLISAQTGKILNKFHSDVGIHFQPDSSLMIVNPPDQELKYGYEVHPNQPLLGEIFTEYKVWKNNKFDVIYKDKWVNTIKSLP